MGLDSGWQEAKMLSIGIDSWSMIAVFPQIQAGIQLEAALNTRGVWHFNH